MVNFNSLVGTLDPTAYAFMSLASNSYLSIKRFKGELCIGSPAPVLMLSILFFDP